MSERNVALYFAWNRPDEANAQLGILDNRWATIFEIRRVDWPRFEYLAGPAIDQGIEGTLEHQVLANYRVFAEKTQAWTRNPIRIVERIAATRTLLDEDFLSSIDTLIVISLDGWRARQTAEPQEIAAVKKFLADPDHSVFVCPHHDIGNVDGLAPEDTIKRQEAELLHHSDHAIPPQQRFGSFGLSLLTGFGAPVRNRFGLRPAHEPDGSPSPIEIAGSADRFGILTGVTTLNPHLHLPHFEPFNEGAEKYDVLAQQKIDLSAPPHPFVAAGHDRFNAILQAKPGVFDGQLVVSDATVWSSVFGGLENLEQLWQNVVKRPHSGP
jgi:hypothetical protein